MKLIKKIDLNTLSSMEELISDKISYLDEKIESYDEKDSLSEAQQERYDNWTEQLEQLQLLQDTLNETFEV